MWGRAKSKCKRFRLKAATEVTNQNQECGPPRNLNAKMYKRSKNDIQKNKNNTGSYCVAQWSLRLRPYCNVFLNGSTRSWRPHHSRLLELLNWRSLETLVAPF